MAKIENTEWFRRFKSKYLKSSKKEKKELLDSLENTLGVHRKSAIRLLKKKESPKLVRRTSVSREDTRNGACEIIMVDNFEVLKEANTSWRKHLRLLKIIYLICFAGFVAFFF